MRKNLPCQVAIVSPCYNEEAVILESAMRLSSYLNELRLRNIISKDSFILYVNDGSKDKTWSLIEQLYKENPFVKGLSLAGNVGHQNAIMAGMMTVKDCCDACITIDADLQDDITAIEKMINCYNEGYDVVYGVKVQRQADPFFKRYSAELFYKLQECLGVKSIYNHADFRLMSAMALGVLDGYKERNLYLRGIIAQMGLKSCSVDDFISERFAGSSKYTINKMLRLAIDGITSFSITPVHLVFILGILFMAIAFLMLLYVLYAFSIDKVVPGWSSIMLSIWFCSGCVLVSLGIIGEYIGKIYIEVKDRPRYNIEKVLM